MACVGLFFVFMFIAFVFAIQNSANNLNLAGGSWGVGGGLNANGVPARAILLQVSNTGYSRRYGGLRYEIRGAYIDVEEPGYQPYEISTQLYIPSNLVRDTLPGSTMEVRIDRSNRNMVVVVGPDVGYVQGAVRTS